MSDKNLLGPWIRRFLLEHLIGERNLARNTQVSYRDTLALLIPFATSKTKKRVEQLAIDHITPEVVRSFLVTWSRSEDAAFLHAISAWPRFTPWHASLLRAAQNTSLGALRFRAFLSKEDLRFRFLTWRSRKWMRYSPLPI